MQRIERVSVTDEVVLSLRSLISLDEYKVGSKLPTESNLCTQLDVGRSSIREALRVLQALGLIDIRSGKGTFVRRKEVDSDKSIREWFIAKEEEVGTLMEVRMAIEPLAARLAITRGTEEQLARINAIHQDFAVAVDRGDVQGMATLDESFHEAIMEASNNPVLMKIGCLLADSLMEYRTRSFAVTENYTHAVVPHARIVKAITERNETESVEAMNSHLKATLEDMRRVIES